MNNENLIIKLLTLPNKNFVDIGISVYSRDMAVYNPDYSSPITTVHIHGLGDDNFSKNIITQMYELGFRVEQIKEKFIIFKRYK
jgi:hypothetical protein